MNKQKRAFALWTHTFKMAVSARGLKVSVVILGLRCDLHGPWNLDSL